MARPLPAIPDIIDSSDEDDVADENYSVLPDQRAICLKLESLDDGADSGAYLTPLRQLLTSHTLPIRVRAGPPFLGTESELMEGDELVLHFIVQRKRVLASDDYNEDLILPVHASQRYDVLPRERLHDDVIFQNTRDIINCIPLPEKVRVQRDFNNNERDIALRKDDEITVSHVEEGDTNGEDKTLIGVCNGKYISLPDGVPMLCTTMIADEPLTLRQVTQRNELPTRVRRDDDKVAMTLRELREETHVIATHLGKKQVVSLPVNALVNLRYEDSEAVLFDAAVPLYEFVNWTMCSSEVGRQPLPLPLQEIPQPLERVLRQWLHSHDGRDYMQEALDRYATYSPCNAKTSNQQEYENFTPAESGVIRRKISIRDKIKHIASRRKSTEISSDTYDSLGSVTGAQILANAQIHEMKMVLSGREKENCKLKEENDRIRAELQRTQDKLIELTASNKQYVEKLHKLYIESDDVSGGIEMKSPRVQSNEYVGMNITTNRMDNENSVVPDVGGEEDTYVKCDKEEHTRLTEASVDDIAQFLDKMDLGNYVDNFRKEYVDGKLLLDLDFETLHGDLKMSRLHAKRLLLEVKKYTE